MNNIHIYINNIIWYIIVFGIVVVTTTKTSAYLKALALQRRYITNNNIIAKINKQECPFT